MIRQLNTIMLAEMVGYTALIQKDEESAKLHRDRQRDVLKSRVDEFGGKILQYYPDGALSVFQSAIEGVNCAVAIQGDLGQEPRVPVRIGIHIGDMVQDQEGVLGDGIEVASRIRDLSIPGGILISGEVADEVKDHPDLTAEPLGEYSLENVERPRAVFAISNPGIAVPKWRDVRGWVEADAKGWVRRKRSKQVGLMAGVGAIAGIAFWAFFDSPDPEGDSSIGLPPAHELVAVLPFSVAGDDSLEFLSEGFQMSLIGSLRSGGFRPVPYQSINSLLTGMPEEGPTGTALGEAVAERFEANLYALGSVFVSGDSLTVTVDLFHRHPDSLVVAHASGKGTLAEYAPLLRSLSRQFLIERSGTDPTFMGDLATDSIKALKAFIEGDRAYRVADYPRAVDLLNTATEIDGDFALAHYRLSQAATWAWQWNASQNAADRALSGGTGRLSPVNVNLVFAWDEFLSGHPVMAEQRYRDIDRGNPNMAEAMGGLGEVMVHYNLLRGKRTDLAKTWFDRVLAIEPDYGEVRFHMLEFAAKERDRETFDSLLAGVKPESEQLLAWRVVRAFGFGTPAERAGIIEELEDAPDSQVALAVSLVLSNLHDFPGAEELAWLLTPGHRDPEWQKEVHGILATLRLAQGQWEAAKEELALVRQDETERGRGWSLETESILSTFPLLNVPRKELADLRESLSAWDPGTAAPPNTWALFRAHYPNHEALRLYALGLLSLELSDTPEYLVHQGSLTGFGIRDESHELGQALSQSLRAHEQLQNADTAGALRQLREASYFPPMQLIPASPFYSRALDRWLSAEILRKSGHAREDTALLEEALAWYETLSDGWGEFLLAAPAHLRQGQVHEELGHRQQAINHYRQFEKLWAEADPPLLEFVRTARNARENLEAEGGR
jgi:class 3 adenylate cyclase/tetratricopeptide (TPR) repeat protein